MNNIKICPFYEQATNILGKRWTPLILYSLLEGPMRFTDLTTAIPQISGKMLASRIKELEQQQIIKRNVYAETPVRIEYELTEKGLAMKPILDAIQKWANSWLKNKK